MKYQGHALGRDVELSIQRGGLRLGDRFVDFADVAALRPVNHRVLVDLLDGSSVEISMLGFSFDGFWEDLLRSFGDRSLEALFVDETELMRCEGEYAFPGGQGRGLHPAPDGPRPPDPPVLHGGSPAGGLPAAADHVLRHTIRRGPDGL